MQSLRVLCWLFAATCFSNLVSSAAALYLPDSRCSEKAVRPLDLCENKEVESAAWNETELPRNPKLLYNRSPTVLHPQPLRARLLDERTQSRAMLDVLQRIYHRDVVLSAGMLHDGVSNLGDLITIRKVIRKLLAGDPVKIVALGGSVTQGHGPQYVGNAYLYQFFSWVNQTFPHTGHSFINHAIPAVTSAYVSPCALNLVPEDTDLVLLEFTFNDSERGSRRLEDPTTRALERMIRKMLQLPHSPGILLVHYWAGRHLEHNFVDTVEDAINTILKFYGVFGLSMRDALHRTYTEDSDFIYGMFKPPHDMDHVHPSCIGSRFLADLLIAHFQDLAASEVIFPTGGFDCSTKDAAAKSLGPPLQQDNWGNLTETCILDPEKVHSLATRQEGFTWTDEGNGKWGFVGTAAGSTLEIDVPFKDLSGEITIGLGFLVSYAHMGIARLDCLEGCGCWPREYSFLHPYGVSLSSWRILETVIPQQAATCKISVKILPQTFADPPETKVKLNSVMLTEEKGFIMPWLFCDQCLQ